MTESTPLKLQYGSQRPWRRRRRVLFRVGAVLVIALVGFSGYRYRHVIAAQYEVIKWQRACMKFTMPEGTPIFVTGSKADDLMNSQTDYSRYHFDASIFLEIPSTEIAAGLDPVCWRSLRQARNDLAGLIKPPITTGGGGLFGGMNCDAVALLHSRTNRKGERLILVEVDIGSSDEENLFMMQASAYEPASAFSRFHEIQSQSLLDFISCDRFTPEGAAPEVITIQIGTIDERDEAQFTIRYAVDGKPGTITGRLTNDDVVELKIRDGPLIGRKPVRRD